VNFKLKLLLATNAINTIADGLILPLFALFVTKIGGGAELAGILFGTNFISGAFFNLFAIKLHDKNFLNNRLFEAGLLIKGFCWVIIAFSQNVPTLIVIQILLGLSGALGGPAFNALVSEHLDNRKHIKEWSIWELVRNCAVATGGFLSGFVLTNFGFTMLFILMAAFELISLALYYSKKEN